MALDGIFLNLLKKELKETCLGGRVEKVHQPSRSELLLHMRTPKGPFRLLLSSSANAPRLHITNFPYENPQTPPKFCMLLRKHLNSAVLTDISQAGLDRVLFLHFDAITEIGQRVNIKLAVEIMARHSNIILIDEDDTVLDSIRRIDHNRSSVRQVLPGLKYKLPPGQNKLDILQASEAEIIEVLKLHEGKNLSNTLLSSLEGFSPLLCREISYRAYGDDIALVKTLDFSNLIDELDFLKVIIETRALNPCLASFKDGKPIDFSFINISQYGSEALCKTFKTLSDLLDNFYSERENFERLKSRAEDLFRFINQAIERTAKKINLQKAELEASEDREGLRIFADLIQANLYRLEKGSAVYSVLNYYEDNAPVKIPVKPYLTPVENSQLYFKRYRKAQRAEEILNKQIRLGEEDLDYFFSVLDALSRAETETELNEIRLELQNAGYLKAKTKKSKQKRQKPLPPIELTSLNGFKVLVGRNNTQNDKLTFKIATKNDLWFHAQKMPGSHVVLILENADTGKNLDDSDLDFAASVAAYYSSGRQNTKINVDYSQIKNLKKPKGSKPGFVIYHVYKTIQAKPFKPD